MRLTHWAEVDLPRTRFRWRAALWMAAASAFAFGAWRLAIAVNVTTSPGPCGLPPDSAGVCPDVSSYDHVRRHETLLVFQGLSATVLGVVLATLAARRALPTTRGARVCAAALVAIALLGAVGPFTQPGLTDRKTRAVYDVGG